MKEKVFIMYGNLQPVALDKVKSFVRAGTDITFMMDSGVITWHFSSAQDTEFVYSALVSRYVQKIEMKTNKEAKEAAKKLDFDISESQDS